MRNRVLHVAVAAALLAVLARSVSAQSLDSLDQTAATRICSRGALRANRLVRVLAHPPGDTTRGSVVGPLQRCGDGVLELGLYPGQETPQYQVPAATIRKVWVRGTQGTWGFIGGALAGGTFGGALAAAKTRICSVGSPPVTSTCHGGNIAASAAIIGGIGALVGLVLGRGFPRWAKVFP